MNELQQFLEQEQEFYKNSQLLDDCEEDFKVESLKWLEDHDARLINLFTPQSHQQGRMEMAEEMIKKIGRMKKEDSSTWTEEYETYEEYEEYNKVIKDIINNLKTNTPTIEVEIK